MSDPFGESGDSWIRLSDAERDAAAADLGEHFAQGRLTVEEHDERLGAIWAARTRGEIAPIFRDLPSPYAAAGLSVPSYAGPRERYWASGPHAFRRGVPTPLLAVLMFLVVLTVLSHLPFILIGLGVLWFVVLRHRGHRWHRRTPGWR